MNSSVGGGPLAGLRILDLTTVIMGPFATRILADMGADVIKVESPEGDSFRSYGPFRHDGMGGSILNLHRNKRSVRLDLKDANDHEALRRLIVSSDALVHNLRPSAASRLGLDWSTISEINPSIILCAARGFGTDGPYGDKPAYDDLMQAASGFAALNQQLYGEPRYAPTSWCDKIAGQAIAYAMLGALVHRLRTGEGQAIEVPMFEVAIDFMLVEHFGGLAFEPPLGPPGFARQLSVRRKPYRTADGYACILPYSDRNWLDFSTFVGRPEIAEDPRFKTIAERVRNVDELYEIVEAEAVRCSTKEWVDFCDRVSIPCIGVLKFEDLEHDEHVKTAKVFQVVEHPTEGSYRYIRPAIRYSATPCELRRHAPRPGQHNQEIFEEIGVAEKTLDRTSGSGAARPERGGGGVR